MKDVQQLKAQIEKLEAENPRMRNIDKAQKLGISEAAFLSLSAGETVTLLGSGKGNDQETIKALLTELKPWGKIMALTRNEHCVHERKGVYENVKIFGGPGNMGVAVNPDIDMRYFFSQWHFIMAVEMEKPGGTLYSFQFFNDRGVAVHKIFSTESSDNSHYHALVEKYRAPYQGFLQIGEAGVAQPVAAVADEDVDVETFHKEWLEMKDTHDFYGMLQKHGLQRTQAFRLAPEGHARRLDVSAYRAILEKAVEREVSIMCFVHSPGCVQIHSGEIHNIKIMGDWFNILDPMFNLHLRHDKVAELWLVRKVTDDGLVTSIELFDEDGELIVYFFGERKPGIPELESWREIVAEQERISALDLVES